MSNDMEHKKRCPTYDSYEQDIPQNQWQRVSLPISFFKK
jgi:hypothetical protein